MEIHLNYPDARDAGELAGGDAPLRVAGVGGAAAVAAAEVEAAAEAREARGKRRRRLAGGAAIVPGARVAHLSTREATRDGRGGWSR